MRPESFYMLVAAMLLALPAQAGPARETKPFGAMTVHDFAAKWMMQQDDIADIGFYAQANADLLASTDRTPRIVLMGDSITYHWAPQLLPNLREAVFVNRGIAGQNSSQMLLRFEDDVIALAPVAVVILAGTNDLRVYAGSHAEAAPAILARIRRNVTAMADIAAARGVKVIIGSVPPILPAMEGNRRDPRTLTAANAWLRAFARQRGYAFAHYAALAD